MALGAGRSAATEPMLDEFRACQESKLLWLVWDNKVIGQDEALIQHNGPFHRRLQRWRYRLHRSDCYWLEQQLPGRNCTS